MAHQVGMVLEYASVLVVVTTVHIVPSRHVIDVVTTHYARIFWFLRSGGFFFL